MTPESRYSSVDSLFVPSHTYDSVGAVDVDEQSDTTSVATRKTLYRLVTEQPAEPPTTMTRATVVSYLHLYANDRFGDAEKWWIIADANPHIRYPLDLKPNDLVYLP